MVLQMPSRLAGLRLRGQIVVGKRLFVDFASTGSRGGSKSKVKGVKGKKPSTAQTSKKAGA